MLKVMFLAFRHLKPTIACILVRFVPTCRQKNRAEARFSPSRPSALPVQRDPIFRPSTHAASLVAGAFLSYASSTPDGVPTGSVFPLAAHRTPGECSTLAHSPASAFPLRADSPWHTRPAARLSLATTPSRGQHSC